MRILILNWRDPQNPASGGAEIVTLKYAQGWVDAGHSVTWLATKYRGSKKREKVSGVTIIRTGNPFTQFLLFPVYYLRHRKEFDLVIDEIHGLPYLTPLYVHKKKLAFIHEVAGEIWNRMFPFPLNKIGLLLEKVSFLPYKSVQFITVSESTKADLKSLGINKVVVIPNGYDPVPVQKFDKEKNPTFIFVSRLVKMKGIEDVIEAFSSISERHHDAQLWIVGSGEEAYLSQLKLKVHALDLTQQVTFLGRVSEEKKFELMRRAHILLHASIKEGWGLVVIEAASQGTPAVVYNVAGLRDSVRDGKTGVITKKNSPKALANEATRLIEDNFSYQRLQTNALKRASELTWDKTIMKSTKIVESL